MWQPPTSTIRSGRVKCCATNGDDDTDDFIIAGNAGTIIWFCKDIGPEQLLPRRWRSQFPLHKLMVGFGPNILWLGACSFFFFFFRFLKYLCQSLHKKIHILKNKRYQKCYHFSVFLRHPSILDKMVLVNEILMHMFTSLRTTIYWFC